MRSKLAAEIISVGNELLIGQTLDTNSNWIAKRLSSLGWNLQRITMLRDSLNVIRLGVQEALRRRPRLLITVGGLGPTYDDMTLKGLALAIGRPLVLNREALEAVRSHYVRMEGKAALTGPRRKMATLPEGAKPLPNPIGTAPGVMVKVASTTIFSLPGVPNEMKAIFKESISPLLEDVQATAPKEVYVRLAGIIESALAPILQRAQRIYPGLYFKSHPQGREGGPESLIQLHIYNVEEAAGRKVEDAVAYLVKNLARIR